MFCDVLCSVVSFSLSGGLYWKGDLWLWWEGDMYVCTLRDRNTSQWTPEPEMLRQNAFSWVRFRWMGKFGKTIDSSLWLHSWILHGTLAHSRMDSCICSFIYSFIFALELNLYLLIDGEYLLIDCTYVHIYMYWLTVLDCKKTRTQNINKTTNNNEWMSEHSMYVHPFTSSFFAFLFIYSCYLGLVLYS